MLNATLFKIYINAVLVQLNVFFVYYKYINRDGENVSRYDYVYQDTNF